MKTKILSLIAFLVIASSFAQGIITPFDQIKLRQNQKRNTATRIMVQDSITGNCGWILKSSLTNGGGSGVGTLNQVLAAGATATDKTASFETTNSSTRTRIASSTVEVQNIPSQKRSTLFLDGLDVLHASENHSFLKDKLVYSTSNTNKTNVGYITPTQTNNINFPNASGTVALTSQISTPTLDEAAAEGNEIIDKPLIVRNQDSNQLVSYDPEFGEFIIENTEGSFMQFGGNLRLNHTNNNVFEVFLNSNGPISEYIRINNLFINPAGLTDFRAVDFQDRDGTVAYLDDITTPTLQQVTDAGNETTNDIKANKLVTQTNGPTKAMILSSSNVTTERNAQWQDKDYTGIADITDIPTQLSQLSEDANHTTVTDAQITSWNNKENAISSGTTSQYWRGDKTWQTLDKSAVGLTNVDNTSDANKPISTATQTALNAKVDVSSRQFATLTANQTPNSTTTPVVLTGHTFTIPAGKTAQVKGVFIFTAAASTTGAVYGIRVTNPTGANGNVIGSSYSLVNVSSASVSTALHDGDSFNVAANANQINIITGTGTSVGNNAAMIDAIVTNTSTNTSATVTVEFASEVSGSDVTPQIGTSAFCEIIN